MHRKLQNPRRLARHSAGRLQLVGPRLDQAGCQASSYSRTCRWGGPKSDHSHCERSRSWRKAIRGDRKAFRHHFWRTKGISAEIKANGTRAGKLVCKFQGKERSKITWWSEEKDLIWECKTIWICLAENSLVANTWTNSTREDTRLILGRNSGTSTVVRNRTWTVKNRRAF